MKVILKIDQIQLMIFEILGHLYTITALLIFSLCLFLFFTPMVKRDSPGHWWWTICKSEGDNARKWKQGQAYTE